MNYVAQKQACQIMINDFRDTAEKAEYGNIEYIIWVYNVLFARHREKVSDNVCACLCVGYCSRHIMSV